MAAFLVNWLEDQVIYPANITTLFDFVYMLAASPYELNPGCSQYTYTKILICKENFGGGGGVPPLLLLVFVNKI